MLETVKGERRSCVAGEEEKFAVVLVAAAAVVSDHRRMTRGTTRLAARSKECQEVF